MTDQKYMLKAAAYIIPRKENKILLALRENTGYMDGKYGLVAGHLESGESIEEAAIREAFEESGIGLTVDQLTFVYLMHRVSNNPDDTYLDVFFEVRQWQGEFTNKEPEKCAGLDWFDIDNLPENTIPYIATILQSYEKGQNFSSQRKEDL